MKIKEGFRMRTLGNEHIVVAEGLKLINFKKMIVLNESAAFLWESVIDKDFTKETLETLLMDKYGIDKELASKDASAIADKWLEVGIIE